MTKQMHRGGLSTSGLVLSLVGAVAVIGGGAYLLSDVWSTKMTSAYSQFSEWTPENIAKDPKNYLNFCEIQAKEAQTKLKARKIAIAISKGKLSAKKQEADGLVAVGTKSLTELKSIWESAESSNTWPVKWNDRPFDKAALGKQIIDLRKDVTQKEKVVAVADKGLKQLAIQETKIKDTLHQIDQQLTSIDSKREMLEIKEITDDVTAELVSMRGVLEGVVEVGDDESGSFNLDELTAAESAKVDDTDVQKALEGI